jgi:multidrug efflux pump subunit AcrB
METKDSCSENRIFQKSSSILKEIEQSDKIGAINITEELKSVKIIYQKKEFLIERVANREQSCPPYCIQAMNIGNITSLNPASLETTDIINKIGNNNGSFESLLKNAVNSINSFPADMEPPVIFKNENLNRVIIFSVSGDNISLKSLKDIAYKIEDDIRAMDGISKVLLHGFPEEEIEIAVNENTLRAYNLTFDDVANAVRRANLDITGGKIRTNEEEYLIRGRYKKYYGRELNNIIIKAYTVVYIAKLAIPD